MQLSIFIVMAVALAVPILMARFNVTAVPTAIAEIVIGMLIGQSGFGWVQTNSSLTLLSSLGVIILMFLSGMEIDFSLFKRAEKPKSGTNPVKLATGAFLMNVVMALIIATILKFTGLFTDLFLSLIIFTTVALGVVIATLKEKEILSRPVGQTILLTAVFGEIFPMFMLTVYGSVNGGNARGIWLIVLPLIVAIILLNRFKQPYLWFAKMTKATTQLDIRLAFFLIFTLVIVAERVGAENILGAFLAGMVMKLLEPSEATMDKLTSIGYGFFIPIFFIMTGVKLDLRSLFTNPNALALIPVMVASFILAKIFSFLVFRRQFSNRNSFAAAFLTVTTITLVLPSLQVARNLKMISATQSDTVTLAAIVVCIISPIIFNSTFKLEKADKIKQRVVFIGTNILTVPIAQQLSSNWYDVRMVTNKLENYQVYDSEFDNLTLIEEISADKLLDQEFLDADVIVYGFRDDKLNAKLSLATKEYSNARVITSFQNREYLDQVFDKLAAAGIEVFNLYQVQSTFLREWIESPSLIQMLQDNEAGIFEVEIRDHRYSGQQLMALPFIDKMTISRIRRGKEWITPHGTTVIEYGDRLIFTAKHHRDVVAIRQALSQPN